MEKVYGLVQQSINNKADFLSSFNSTYLMAESENGDLTVADTYYFDETNNILSLFNSGARQIYYKMLYQNMNLGDLIEVEFDVMLVSGAGVRIFVLENGATTIYTETIIPENLGVWKHIKRSYIAKSNAFIQVSVGLNTLASNIKLKNVTSSVKRNRGVGASTKVPVYKKGNIAYNGSIWTYKTDFVYDAVTFSNVDVNTLQITYATPFTGLKPIVIINSQSSGMTYTLIPKSQNSVLTGFQLKFYDFAGVVIPLANLPTNVYVDFIALGEKLLFD